MEGCDCTIKWQTERKPSSHFITDVFLAAFQSIPSSDSTSEALFYPQSVHKGIDPKMSLPPIVQQNTQTQSDRAKLFMLISCAVQRVTYMPLLRCPTAIVINLLEPPHPNPSIPASNAHFLRLLQPARRLPSFRFFAQTLFRGIVWCTKTSGFASDRWFSSTTHWVHNVAHHFMF